MAKEIKLRKDVCENDKWDLSSLYPCDEAWENDFKKLQKKVDEASLFKGTLGKSPENLLAAAKWDTDVTLLFEQLANYAFLKYAAEANNTENQRMTGMISQLETQLSTATAYYVPEILSIPNIDKWLEKKDFDDYRVSFKKMLRKREHTLSQSEEAILARQGELQDTPRNTFGVLTNVDMDFGTIDNTPLTQSTYSVFIHNQDRCLREKAYKQFYKTYENHQQTIASLYTGSVKQDIFNATVRGYKTALDATLFQDDVPKSVYTGLIETVHKGFPALHRYYSLRKKILGVDKLKHYDVYVPLVDEVKVHTTYDEAVEVIKTALKPLGEDYVKTLYKGLTSERWVDRYENKGKRSGAFSSGGYIGYPYILINYNEEILDSVFTLAHEGGHSMHSYYSKRNNPFSSYNYTIFEAEVASTFNEQLIAKYYMDNAKDINMKKYIIAKQLDDIIATLFRQTMFAEFELLAHTKQEEGEPLTVELLRKLYRGLLEAYFGPEMEFEDVSDLEGLRIPHFYNAYYVYKYATGISAAIALSEKVLNGGEKELEDYLGFLKSGGSKFPIESLKKAGVDMSTPEPVESAIKKFESLLDEFEKLI